MKTVTGASLFISKKKKKRRHTGRRKQADAQGKNKKANKSWYHHKVLAVTRLFT